MTDAERGNTTHGPRLDDQLEQESRGMVQGHPGSPHAEPFRESEGLPDDTDASEVDRAFRRDSEDEIATDDEIQLTAHYGQDAPGGDDG